MGLFKKIKKAAKKAFKVAAPIAATTGFSAALGPAGAQLLPQVLGRTIPVLGRTLPPILGRPPGGPLLPRIPGGGGGGGRPPLLLPDFPLPGIGNGAGACPGGFHLAKDGSGRCVRNRRMNPMNPRAARRAIRRIKAARKMLMQIERQLPKQRSRGRAPAGHRARLTHE